jgi:hypothetical protein
MPAATAFTVTALDWEKLWAPYDEPTYQAVLEQIRPEDVVLEIGAGDFRLARRMAGQCRLVYAIELNRQLISLASPAPAAHNQPAGKRNSRLKIIWADAYTYPFPQAITVGVLLMRHCRQFHIFAGKLAAAGCTRLVTNARWGMGVEVVDLVEARPAYADLPMGWFACWCGATGFKPGPPEKVTPWLAETVHEVGDCPACRPCAASMEAPNVKQ